MNSNPFLPLIFIGCFLLFMSIFSLNDSDGENEKSILGNEPDIVMTMMNRTCYGFHNTEKDRGIKTTNWFCDDGYIMHDPTGVVIPKDEVYEEAE